jgi:predicted small lipoprotein YifL
MTMPLKSSLYPTFIYSGALSGACWSLFVRRTLPILPAIVFAAAIALSLASCGRRGPLEPPPGAAVSSAPVTGTPGDYEAPANPGELAGQNTATSSGTEAPSAGKHPPPPARKPFVLDPLL